MKPSQSKNKTALTFVILFCGVIFLSSCLKNNDDFTPITAFFSVVNGYSSLNSVDVYLDQQRTNTQPLLYKQNTEYLQAYSGRRRLTITEGGTTDILIDGAVDLSNDRYYSIFIARRSATNADSIAGIQVLDDLAAPSGTTAKIRFANLTPGNIKVDVYVKGVADTLFGNKGFATVSAFKEVDPTKVTAIEIRETGKPEVKLEVPLTLQAGKIYTLSTNGLWTSTSPATTFGTQLTVNK